jgi:hypothetical protein
VRDEPALYRLQRRPALLQLEPVPVLAVVIVRRIARLEKETLWSDVIRGIKHALRTYPPALRDKRRSAQQESVTPSGALSGVPTRPLTSIARAGSSTMMAVLAASMLFAIESEPATGRDREAYEAYNRSHDLLECCPPRLVALYASSLHHGGRSQRSALTHPRGSSGHPGRADRRRRGRDGSAQAYDRSGSRPQRQLSGSLRAKIRSWPAKTSPVCSTQDSAIFQNTTWRRVCARSVPGFAALGSTE